MRNLGIVLILLLTAGCTYTVTAKLKLPDKDGIFRTVQRLEVVSKHTRAKVVVTDNNTFEVDMHKPQAESKNILGKALGMATYPLGQYLGREETKNVLGGGEE